MKAACKGAFLTLVLLAVTVAHGQLDSSRTTTSAPFNSSPAIADTTDSLISIPREAVPREELKVVRRKYKYRSQVALAVFMMVFVALAMTTTQALNPD